MKTKVSSLNNICLTVDEIIAYLKRTGLPTILVEGSDDKAVYRYIESKLGELEADILICNSRDALLKIYKRKDEFENSKVVFVADKDMWYFTGIPEEYQNNIIFSKGYSIENDIYIKEIFEGLLEEEEKQQYIKLIKELSRWFAFEVNRYKSEGFSLCDTHINKISDINSNELRDKYLKDIGFVEPDKELIDEIIGNYNHALRGKNLFQALLRFLSSSKRISKYSRQNLLEIGSKNRNENIGILYKNIENCLK